MDRSSDPASRSIRHRAAWLLTLFALAALPARAAPPAATQPAAVALRPLGSPPRAGVLGEWVLDGVGVDGVNAYDPDQIAVDAVDGPPGGGARITGPLFWYVGYTRALWQKADGTAEERLTPDPAVAGQWRWRWTPRTAGRHHVVVTVRKGDRAEQVLETDVDVEKSDSRTPGFAGVDPASRRYFKTDDGRPLPLLGMNACWPGKRGTYDFDDWLPAMGAAGMNYTRLWMGNAGFRCELYAGERLNYSQATLWQLDTVLDAAGRNGIYVMLCLGFHGEFQTEHDAWGHDGWWSTHAYQKANGGPCERPNDFFTDPAAAKLYEKRLRYLVARYGARPNLFSWQLFNEINNFYADASADRATAREKNRLYPPDVTHWHERMSTYLHAIDPYGHLVTTSFGSAGEDAAMWKLPGLDYCNWHWYTNWGGPFKAVTQMTASVGQRLPATYGKPAVIAEFGTDGIAWTPANDTERRGLRQALWGGLFSGTAGTAMPWWWEDVHRENLYPLWKSLHDFLPSEFAGPQWKVVSTFRPAPPPAPTLLSPAADAPRFSQRVDLSTKWGKGPGLPVVINRPGDDGEGVVAGYVYGRAKPELHTPFGLQVNAGEGATLVLHLNSVANDDHLVVSQNGHTIFERDFPDKDGKAERNHEYDQNIAVPLQPGRAELDIANTGKDWLFLDWVRVDGALACPERTVAPAEVPLEKYVLGDGTTQLLWIVDSRFSWPRNRKSPAAALAGASVTLSDWPEGDFVAEWWDTAAGRPIGVTRATSAGARLVLSVPEFRGDIAARITRSRATGK